MVPVPPLLALAFGVLGAAFIVKHVAKEWRKPKADVDRDEAAPVEQAKTQAVQKLRRDPQTGVYRP
jgi:hypothetical protein